MSICLTALLGGMLPIPQSGIEQHEQFSMRATAYLEQQGPSLVGSKFELLFSDGSLNIFTADEDAVLSFVNGNDLHSKYKIVGVNEIDGGYATKVILLSHSHEDGLELQQNANLIIDWNLSPQLSISKINVVDCQQLTSERSLFYDDEQSVIDPQLNRSKLAPGLNYWQRHIAVSLGFSTKSHQGIAVADVNGDGLEDLYLPQPAGISNSILLQDQFGRFNDYANEAGLDFLDASRSALFVDLDNDSDQDLITTFPGFLAVFENDSEGKFELAYKLSAAEVTSLAAADIDNDGLVDVYACRYLNPYENQAVPKPYNDANNGLNNLMLKNNGQLQFEDVTAKVGLNSNNMRFSFAASFEDYDNDGDQDLYVANDYGRNNLYQNQNGNFKDVAAVAGVEDISAGMGVSWGDYDNDGWVDLYVSNMYSGAGQRITYQRDFMPGADQTIRRQMQRHARGNSLFKNMGDGSFKDVALESNTTMGRWAWGSIFFDFNNDSLLDIFVPNGFTTNDQQDDL